MSDKKAEEERRSKKWLFSASVETGGGRLYPIPLPRIYLSALLNPDNDAKSLLSNNTGLQERRLLAGNLPAQGKLALSRVFCKLIDSINSNERGIPANRLK